MVWSYSTLWPNLNRMENGQGKDPLDGLSWNENSQYGHHLPFMWRKKAIIRQIQIFVERHHQQQTIQDCCWWIRQLLQDLDCHKTPSQVASINTRQLLHSTHWSNCWTNIHLRCFPISSGQLFWCKSSLYCPTQGAHSIWMGQPDVGRGRSNPKVLAHHRCRRNSALYNVPLVQLI